MSSLQSAESLPRSAPSIEVAIDPHTLNARLQGKAEIALLDVREVGVFARKHLLMAVPAPLWRLELLIDRLVPRRSTGIVLVDLDESLVHTAAARLRRLGYTDVSILAGGTLAWEAAGLAVFSGDNVPSKAFGEFIEHEAGTPNVDVATLRGMQARGEKLLIVDGRTPEEFYNFSLPGAHSVPNGELALRVRDLVPDAETMVVVNCAGRTRSIIGAQSLIDAGLPNRVAALKDGTMAWLLAGHSLQHGRKTALPQPSSDHLGTARAGAAALSRRAGVGVVDTEGLGRLQAALDRTLYRFDTRTSAEYRSGHLPGWRWAPGGQLLQATDQYVGVQHARIVLADWDGVRAHVTGAFLAQMGVLEVYLYCPHSAEALEPGDERWTLVPDPELPDAPWITPEQAHELIQSGDAVAFDVDKSLSYGKRHVAGAFYAAPHRLADFAAAQAADKIVVTTSSDGVLGHRMAGMLCSLGRKAHAILGGNAAWFDAGLPTEAGRERVLTGEDDAWYGGYAYDDEKQRHAKFREYLTWEVELTEQMPLKGARPPFRRIDEAKGGYRVP